MVIPLTNNASNTNPASTRTFLMKEIYDSLGGDRNPNAFPLIQEHRTAIVLIRYGYPDPSVPPVTPPELADHVILSEVTSLLKQLNFYDHCDSCSNSSSESATTQMKWDDAEKRVIAFDFKRTGNCQRTMVIDLTKDIPELRKKLIALNLPVEISFKVNGETVESNVSSTSPNQVISSEASRNILSALMRLEGIKELLSASEYEILENLWKEHIKNGVLYHGTSSAFRDSIEKHGLNPNYKPYENGEVERLSSIWNRIYGYQLPFFNSDHYLTIGLTCSSSHAMEYGRKMPEKIGVMLSRVSELLGKKDRLENPEINFLEALSKKYEHFKNPNPIVVKVQLLPCLFQNALIGTFDDSFAVNLNDPLTCLLKPELFAEFIKERRFRKPDDFKNFHEGVELYLKAFIGGLTDLRVPFVEPKDTLEIR